MIAVKRYMLSVADTSVFFSESLLIVFFQLSRTVPSFPFALSSSCKNTETRA